VKDEWQKAVFEEMQDETRLGSTTMNFHDQKIELEGCPMSKVRRLIDTGLQTRLKGTVLISALNY
jgi:hypothetical protein